MLLPKSIFIFSFLLLIANICGSAILTDYENKLPANTQIIVYFMDGKSEWKDRVEKAAIEWAPFVNHSFTFVKNLSGACKMRDEAKCETISTSSNCELINHSSDPGGSCTTLISAIKTDFLARQKASIHKKLLNIRVYFGGKFDRNHTLIGKNLMPWNNYFSVANLVLNSFNDSDTPKWRHWLDSTIKHELGHILGLSHEQENENGRLIHDPVGLIKSLPKGEKTGWIEAYTKVSDAGRGSATTFDVQSIMLYNLKSLISLQGWPIAPGARVGGSYAISNIDKSFLAYLYPGCFKELIAPNHYFENTVTIEPTSGLHTLSYQLPPVVAERNLGSVSNRPLKIPHFLADPMLLARLEWDSRLSEEQKTNCATGVSVIINPSRYNPLNNITIPSKIWDFSFTEKGNPSSNKLSNDRILLNLDAGYRVGANSLKINVADKKKCKFQIASALVTYKLLPDVAQLKSSCEAKSAP